MVPLSRPQGPDRSLGQLAARFIAGAILLCGLSMTSSVATAKPLNLGMIHDSPSKMFKRFGPFMQYLQANGVETGKIITAKSVEEMAEHFKAGRVDLLFESPFGAIELMQKAGVKPLLIREKSGKRSYNSVIFVRAESDVESFKDLTGKVVAFEDPNSTSSFQLPRTLLTDAGLELVKSRKPVPGKVAYYFSNDDVNTLAQVKSGRVAQAGGIKASALDGKSEFRALEPGSAHVPRHVTLIGPNVDANALKELLLGMRTHTQAKAALKAMKTPTGFSEFDGDPVAELSTVAKALGI